MEIPSPINYRPRTDDQQTNPIKTAAVSTGKVNNSRRLATPRGQAAPTTPMLLCAAATLDMFPFNAKCQTKGTKILLR